VIIILRGLANGVAAQSHIIMGLFDHSRVMALDVSIERVTICEGSEIILYLFIYDLY
jgi:hypothetical protein